MELQAFSDAGLTVGSPILELPATRKKLDAVASVLLQDEKRCQIVIRTSTDNKLAIDPIQGPASARPDSPKPTVEKIRCCRFGYYNAISCKVRMSEAPAKRLVPTGDASKDDTLYYRWEGFIPDRISKKRKLRQPDIRGRNK
ncbi:hypothetical protein J6590_098225, partial [Homalodisca vitripennis]